MKDNEEEVICSICGETFIRKINIEDVGHPDICNECRGEDLSEGNGDW